MNVKPSSYECKTLLTMKNEKRKTSLTMKRLQPILAFTVVVFGVVMITAAFLVPPTGVIDPSVLAAFGEILTFSGSLIGIDYHYRYRQQE